MRRWFFLTMVLLAGEAANAQDAAPVITAYSFAQLGTPKYAQGFAHFDYVNPDAPKGGSVTLAARGSYDNFHAYALRGNMSYGDEYFFDTLMTGSLDEAGVYYPLIAEKIEYSADGAFVIFYIDPRARAHDGKPLTAEDAAFTFQILYEKGVPQFRANFEGTRATVLDNLRVRFDIPEQDGRFEVMSSLLTLPVFPKRFWLGADGKELHDFSEPLLEPPLCTGPYKVSNYVMGKSVTLSRVKDYWAQDLPSRKGLFNFDTIRYDYYLDENVAFEAFKAGEYDFREENAARRWAEEYTGRLFDTGRIVREEIPHEIPQGMQALVFNIQRPIFADRRIREALNYFLDFEWMNRAMFYGQYTRTRSYFQNTEYAARGLPSAGEIAILAPFRDKAPPEVWTTEFNPPVNPGNGDIRANVRKAIALLKDAGWELKNGKMLNKAGERFSFEFLIYDASSERIGLPVQRNLAKYGIEMRIRTIDTSQYVNRMRSRDFDMIGRVWSPLAYPNDALQYYWHSKFIDSTYNSPGVEDELVDYLVEGIISHQGDKDALFDWGRALDRVLTWNHYVIPEWHISRFRIAYTDKFARPAVRPKYDVGLDTWWVK